MFDQWPISPRAALQMSGSGSQGKFQTRSLITTEAQREWMAFGPDTIGERDCETDSLRDCESFATCFETTTWRHHDRLSVHCDRLLALQQCVRELRRSPMSHFPESAAYFAGSKHFYKANPPLKSLFSTPTPPHPNQSVIGKPLFWESTFFLYFYVIST
jgi:hypothetical protein